MCANSYMNTRKKRKIKIHTGSVSKMVLFMVNFQDQAEKKKFFKVCLVGSLNLCLKELEMINSARENGKKMATISQFLFFGGFWEFSQPRVIGFISILLHPLRHLETQV